VLFEAPGASEYLCAAILDPETLYQRSTSAGQPLFPERLKQLGILPGVKPHLKVYQLPGQPAGATTMQGLDSLGARLQEYKQAGAVFAKWRAPMAIDEATGMPSDLVIEANMVDLARYALICQDVGLVPIVEPDVSMAGTHTLEAAVAINTKIQATLYKAMLEHGVFMEGAILKSNIVNPGKKCTTSYSVRASHGVCCIRAGCVTEPLRRSRTLRRLTWTSSDAACPSPSGRPTSCLAGSRWRMPLRVSR